MEVFFSLVVLLYGGLGLFLIGRFLREAVCYLEIVRCHQSNGRPHTDSSF